jgi:hypothetical protein
MFGSTRYPFNFCNRNGIPMVESNSVTVGTDNVVITLPNRVFRWLNDKGVILFRLNQSIPAGTTTTLPIVFSANDFTQPLTNLGGEAITVAQLPSTGVYMIYYDKNSNLMQLLTTEIPAA